jgi:hypothetical protein
MFKAFSYTKLPESSRYMGLRGGMLKMKIKFRKKPLFRNTLLNFTYFAADLTMRKAPPAAVAAGTEGNFNQT